MLNVGLELYLAHGQAYIQPWKESEKANSKERNRKAAQVLLTSFSVVIKQWDKKLFCFV